MTQNSSRLLKLADKIDAAIDTRLPQDPESQRRRKRAVRGAGAVAAALTASLVAGNIPVSQGSADVIVEQGDTYSGVVLKGQEMVATANKKVNPEDQGYIPAGDRLEHQLATQMGRSIRAGDEVEVNVTRSFFGSQDVEAHLKQ